MITKATDLQDAKDLTVMSVDAGHHGIGLYVDMGETGRLDDDGLSGEPGSQTGRRTDLDGSEAATPDGCGARGRFVFGGDR